MNVWEPYFKPTRRVHESGYRCFECGYLQRGDDKKAVKKVVIGHYVDHISNWLLNGPVGGGTKVDFDLLKDGHIRVFNHARQLYWSVPGWSDAELTADVAQACPSYDQLDAIYDKQENQKGNVINGRK